MTSTLRDNSKITNHSELINRGQEQAGGKGGGVVGGGLNHPGSNRDYKSIQSINLDDQIDLGLIRDWV